MLHTLMTSPYQCDFALLLAMLQEGDDLLLLQDGVIAALEGSDKLAQLAATPAVLWVLQDDVAARGLVAQISTRATTISYNDFVALTVKHPQQMTW